MGEVKNFDTSTKEPIPFILAGKELHISGNLDVSFYLTEYKGVQGSIDFINSVLTPESRPIFEEMVADPTITITLAQLLDVGQWVLEVTSGRPIAPPDSSPNGLGRTPNGSKGKQLSAVKTGSE